MVRKIEVYADGADLDCIRRLGNTVAGFTSNPSLMKQAGIGEYEKFAKAALKAAGGRPVSFEVISDDFGEMERQGRLIASWGAQAVVKVPIVNSRGESAAPVISSLSADGIPLNVTAVMSGADFCRAIAALRSRGNIISIFAGRIADTGRDPEVFVRDAARLNETSGQRILWASTREVFNVVQAERSGAHIITMTPELIDKMKRYDGYNLEHYTLDTVRQFARDAKGVTL